jgi:hypothetical protein
VSSHQSSMDVIWSHSLSLTFIDMMGVSNDRSMLHILHSDHRCCKCYIFYTPWNPLPVTIILHVHVQYILHTPIISNIDAERLLQATALSGGARGTCRGCLKMMATPRSRLVNRGISWLIIISSYSLQNYIKLPFLGYTVVYSTTCSDEPNSCEPMF